MRAWITVLMVATAFAGCIDEESPVDAPVETTEAAPALPTTVAAAQNRTVAGPDHAFLLPVPERGGLAGFEVPVPDDRAHPSFEGSSFIQHHVILEWQFDAPAAEAVAAFYRGGDMVALSVWVPTEAQSYLTAALPTDVGGPASYERTSLTASADVFAGTLSVVVGATGVDGPVALAIHFDDVPRDPFEDLPDPLQDGVALKAPIGTGSDFDYQERSELAVGLVAPVGLIGAVTEAGTPTRTERLPTYVFPHGGARDVLVAASCDLGGWSQARTSLLFGEGGGTFAHSVAAGNASAQDDGVMAWARGYGFLAGALALGLPIGVASGTGAATATIDVQMLATNELSLLNVVALCFDASLEHLTGVRANESATVLDGLVRRDAWRPGGVRGFGPFS